MTLTKIKITDLQFYPEEFRRKIDQEKYQAKGTCEVSLGVNDLEFEIKNITYRIDHNGNIHLKPPYRVHSNKKAGIKPKLVPSIVFKDKKIWEAIEARIKEELELTQEEISRFERKKPLQLVFWYSVEK